MRVSVDYGGGRRIPDARAGRDELGVLAGFRGAWHGCLTRRADALFELTDALLCAPGPVSSVPSLSLEPTFRRGHGSLYAALAKGRVDAKAARELLVANRPGDWPLVFAVDTSGWPRCDAEWSPQRGLYHHPSRHSAGQPIVAGWSYAWIAQLSWDTDSWTAPLDSVRVPPAGRHRAGHGRADHRAGGPAGCDRAGAAVCARRRLRPGRADGGP